MIIFSKIRWKNLLSTGNVFTEIDVLSNKTTLIVGENGAGKSTILDALSFGLFNKPFRKINKPQLMNSITKKELVVEVEFSIGNSEYKVVRGIKPNIFELYKDGKLLNQDAAARDYQHVLESQILKINHKSFCQVVVLGSASFVPFMQLPAQSRREIIEDLLDLQIFTSMNSLLKDRIATNSSEIQTCNSDKKLIKSKLDMAKDHAKDIKLNNEKIIEDKMEKIEAAKKQIAETRETIDELIVDAKKLAEQLKSETAVKARLDKINSYNVQLKSKIANASKTIGFFENHDNCPTCKQGIDHEFKQITIQAKSSQIDEVEKGLQTLESERVKVLTQIEEFSKITNQLNDKNLKISLMNTKIAGWSENIRLWETEIESINTQQKKSINVQNLKDLETNLKELETKFNTLHDEKQVLATAASILKDGGIKSKILKQYIPIINKFINKYLTAMDFFVNFELNEQFDETIKSRFRDEFSYASFSEGEKMRINLAILFTWRAVSKLRNSINTNLLIMDEVFDSSLDSNGTDEFLKILLSLAGDTNTFIISHKTDQLYDKFEKVIRFEKHKNFSKMVA